MSPACPPFEELNVEPSLPSSSEPVRDSSQAGATSTLHGYLLRNADLVFIGRIVRLREIFPCLKVRVVKAIRGVVEGQRFSLNYPFTWSGPICSVHAKSDYLFIIPQSLYVGGTYSIVPYIENPNSVALFLLSERDDKFFDRFDTIRIDQCDRFLRYHVSLVSIIEWIRESVGDE